MLTRTSLTIRLHPNDDVVIARTQLVGGTLLSDESVTVAGSSAGRGWCSRASSVAWVMAREESPRALRGQAHIARGRARAKSTASALSTFRDPATPGLRPSGLDFTYGDQPPFKRRHRETPFTLTAMRKPA